MEAALWLFLGRNDFTPPAQRGGGCQVNAAEFVSRLGAKGKPRKTLSGWICCCQSHDDKTPSLSVADGDSGGVIVKCFAGCTVDAICAAIGLTVKDLMPPRQPITTTPPAKPIAAARESFDWQNCVADFSEGDAQKLATWRGLSIEFVRWLQTQNTVGIFEGKIAFANHCDGGAVVSAHFRLDSGIWNFKPKGHKTAPLIFGNPKTAGFVMVFESQFDAFAVMDKLGWHTANGLPDTAVLITRGAGNGKLIAGQLSPDAVCYAFKQNDEPTPKKPIPAADVWLADIASNAGCKVLNVATPAPHKDCNDWTRAGATKADLDAAIAAAKLVQPPDTAPTWTPQAAQPENGSATAPSYDSFAEAAKDPLPGNDDPPEHAGTDREVKNGFTIRTPDEILDMVFNDDDIIVGDRIIAEGQSCVFVAAGGLGKSRISLQIPACVATGHKFLNFTTGKENSNWLFLQTENSNRRLQSDLRPLKSWLGEDWPKFAAHVKFHTVENDTDAFVNLDSPDAVANIQAAIKLHAPDIIVIDPLNDFAIGDLNKDADMKMTLQTLSRICRKGNPKRAIVVLHHALTGKAGASKATGFDRASFGRNSKTLHAWTRAQINLAPVDPDSNDRLIVACGKCSNGKEFQTFAVRLNPDTMIYEVDPTVDVSQWEQDITGAKDTAPLMNPARVRELCATAGSSKAELAKAIMDDCGCYRGSAYRYITRAEQAKKIAFNKSNDKYFRK
jgi:hypothetical protein